MNLRQVRAFATELLKIAEAGPLPIPLDPDMRALRAERRSEEYLQGGRLPSNDSAETKWVPKIAESWRTPGVIDAPSLKDRAKDAGTYQKSRDYALSGVYGATTGGALTGLVEKMRGPNKPLSGKAYATGALIGGGAALADRAYRYHKKLLKKPKTIVDKAKAQAMKEKAANLASGFSPGKALKASSQTHQFQPGRYHTGSTTQAAGQIGQHGRLPGGGR